MNDRQICFRFPWRMPANPVAYFETLSKPAVAVSFLLVFGIVRPAHAQMVYSHLHSFAYTNLSGAATVASLIEAGDGALYGTTFSAASAPNGTVFKLNKDGTAYSVLRTFAGTGGDGRNPSALLLEGSDGALYGTTTLGGNADGGTVFKLSKDGSTFAILKSFGGEGDGRNPRAALMEGSDGVLYGTTAAGGATNQGTLFKLNKDGSDYSILRRLTASDGVNPVASLLEGSDGVLYGTTTKGGGKYGGTVFKLNKDGSAFTVLRNFPGFDDDGLSPEAALIEGSDGVLYGTTARSGFGTGIVFKLNKDGNDYAKLFGFWASGIGTPGGAVTEGIDGALYGTTMCAGDCGTVFRLNKDGSGHTVLHKFSGGEGDGQDPRCTLVRSTDGWMYGTTSGSRVVDPTVFRLTPDGTGFSVLHVLQGNGADGNYPRAPVIEGSDGALYGTTYVGGNLDRGTVYRLNKDGSAFTILHNFSGSDGYRPKTSLLEGSDGVLYGTACCGGLLGQGVIFKLNRDGSSYGVIHHFTNSGMSGFVVYPSGLLEGSDGLLYGTTESGGSNVTHGSVFRIQKDGNGYTELYGFPRKAGLPEAPIGALVEGSDGALYGASTLGGSAGFGTVFKLQRDGTGLMVLHSFTSAENRSTGGLLQASDGLFYGTTGNDGTGGLGSVFRMGGDGGAFEVLRRFSGYPTDGSVPLGPLVEGSDGALYGATEYGGTNENWGTVLRLNKDGTDYSLLWSCRSLGGYGWHMMAPLAIGRDGALYGTTARGGDFDKGTIFRLGPPPNRVSLTRTPGGFRLRFGGEPGRTYELQRTVDFNHWTKLVSFVAPLLPFLDYEDTEAPAEVGFYRAVME